MAASPDAVLHLAALHTLASAGFASTSRAASLTLSSVMARYLQLVASSCAERAALGGRTKVAAVDVMDALDDLGVGGITELQEWTLDLDREVVFTGARLDELAGSLHDGLSITEGVDRFYVPVDTDDEEDDVDEVQLQVEEHQRAHQPNGLIEKKEDDRDRPVLPTSPVKLDSPDRIRSPQQAASPERAQVAAHAEKEEKQTGQAVELASPTKPHSPTHAVNAITGDGTTEGRSSVKATTPAQAAEPVPTAGDVEAPETVKPASPVKPTSPLQNVVPVPAGSPVKEDESTAKANTVEGHPSSPQPVASPVEASSAVKLDEVKAESPNKDSSDVAVNASLPATAQSASPAKGGIPLLSMYDDDEDSDGDVNMTETKDEVTQNATLSETKGEVAQNATVSETKEGVTQDVTVPDSKGEMTQNVTVSDSKDEETASAGNPIPTEEQGPVVKMEVDDDTTANLPEPTTQAIHPVAQVDMLAGDEKDIDRGMAMAVDDSQLPTPPPSPPYLRVNYRPRSPDMSWLPPLPTADVQTVAATGADIGDTVPAPQSLADRYRLPVAYRTSQLAEAHTFTDPPKPSRRPNLPSAPSSFQSLVTTYEATLTEPSMGLRQTDGRRQAADLLRLTVGNPDRFSTRDTLAQTLPPPQISPIVPSHSDVLPPRLLPVNPNQSGVISSILHQVRTPFLPPTLRDRLTSLRPPQAQSNDQGLVFFGEPVRGADDAALAKARGKTTGEESTTELRATWDSGPKGQEKWSRGRLPSGRKVIKAVEGASAPRESNASKALRLKIADRMPALADPGTPVFSPATTLKLRLGSTPKIQTPTVERRRAPSTLSMMSSPPHGAGHGKRRSSSPRKSASPIKQEPMQLD